MTVAAIPTLSGDEVDRHSYDRRVKLAGARYVFTFDYNERIDTWQLTIADANGVVFLRRASLVRGVQLLARVFNSPLPGALFVLGSEDPGLRTLGISATLWWFSADEL